MEETIIKLLEQWQKRRKSNKIVACLMAVFLSIGMFSATASAYVEGDVNADAVSEDISIVAEEESEEVAAFWLLYITNWCDCGLFQHDRTAIIKTR